jgi:Secretion system C-terminal sorting domain
MKKNLILTNLLVLSLSITSWATNYYVSTFGISTNNGLTSLTPFPTIQKAADLTVAGDTVFIMNASTYSAVNGPILTVRRSGAPNAYITYKAFPGHTPKIKASGPNIWNTIVVNANYIVIDGLELEGNNANLTYTAALAAYNDAAAGGTNWAYYATFNTNAITIGGPAAESLFPHHVVVRNCKVHDFPSGGLNSIQADYTTFENNLVYNNAWYTMYASSGINIYHPFNSDTVTGYKNIVRNNIAHTNKTTIPWVSSNPRILSDGNGIIIDINQRPYGTPVGTLPAYGGRTLVENNISVNNGGSGIHTFKADHVDIINNTAFNNGTSVGYAEIFSNQCNDVKLINNIMYARTGGDCNSNPSNATQVYSYNLYYNGTVRKMGANDVVADPKFANPSIDRLLGDFKLLSSSPARNTGSSIAGQYSLKDILGTPRPQGAQPDKGAYEMITTSLSTIYNTEKIIISPNPALDYVLLENVIEGSSLELYDSLGQKVLEQKAQSTTVQIDISKLNHGIYILKIMNSNNSIQVGKFVKASD